MTAEVDPRQSPILNDDWEPPPPRPRRFPVFLVACVLVIVGVGFVAIRAEPPAQRDPAGAVVWNPVDVVASSPRAEPPPVPRPPSPLPRRPLVRRRPVGAGYLAVNSTPWAELSVDGRVVGNTPQLSIRVTPGRHELLFAREGFETQRSWVTVGPSMTVRITNVALKRITP